MKQIKFRAKPINEDRWIYGGGVWTFGDKTIMLGPETRAVHPLSACLFTGMRDRKSTEVFHKDIVRGQWSRASKCLVQWDLKRCGFYLQPIDPEGRLIPNKGYKMYEVNFEVIGNVIDQPDMVAG
jgi:hypothetical protein